MTTIRCRRTQRLHSLSWVSFLLVLWLSPLTASAVDLTGLSLTPPNPVLNVSDTLQLIATGSYDDGTQLEIAKAKQVSAGGYHTCALSTGGMLRCWGINGSGQLGNGTTINSLIPVAVSSINTAVAVSTGYRHTCALLTDGTVKCWGANPYGQLGNGTMSFYISNSTPVAVSGISTAVAVSAGRDDTCAVLADGTIKCWGINEYGQLGNGTTTNSSTPVTVSGINNAVAVSTDSYHTCALLADGKVRCWGSNGAGQLGDRTNTNSSTPVAVSGISTAMAISAGYAYTCAVLADGTLRCWGDNRSGQLGDGTNFFSSVPVTVSGIHDAVAITAGYDHTCTALADGTLRCWGNNYYGQLGNGTNSNSSIPVTVSGINTAVAVSVGRDNYYTCAVLANGTIKCWGYNDRGQFGNGTTTATAASIPELVAVTAAGVSNAVVVTTGGAHTCAALIDGTLQCWGANGSGQLGNGVYLSSWIPIVVSGMSTVVAVSADGFRTCALLADGTVWCWGYLSFSGYSNSSTPVAVIGIDTAVAVSTAHNNWLVYQNSTCALLADGTIKCWGDNRYGQLGNGTTSYSGTLTPTTVSATSTAVAVSAGGAHTCAVLADGTVQCWGYNLYGQLGNGTTTDSTTPVAVSGIHNAVAVSVGVFHTCAVLTDGTIKCWGRNTVGELGNGTLSDTSTPVTVSGISTAVAVSAGVYHTCAVLTDGTVQCWGYNLYGQLGDGATYISASTPVSVNGISTAVAVSAGGTNGYDGFTCALLADGTIKCWGDNRFGQLGNITDGLSPTSTLGYHPLTWTSSNPSVASVDGVGQVQALAPGTTQITTSVNGLSASTTVTVIGQPPVTTDVNLTVESGKSITWIPKATDPDGDPVTCRLGTPPTNGTATIAPNCTSGTYQSTPGFIGTDSFTYLANDGQYDSNPGTVTVAVTEPGPSTVCTSSYPLSQFSHTGKAGSLTVGFTGNIVSYTNKAVKVCPGTNLNYLATSTQGPVVCKVKNNTTRGGGMLRINDHLKCTDKPAGKDKVQFKVKSGVN